jgi:hypothetical protein
MVSQGIGSQSFEEDGAFSNHILARKLCALGGTSWTWMEKAIEVLKAYRNEEIDGFLAELASAFELTPGPPGRPFLTWEEAQEMFRSGLISFGSHTAGHHILTSRTDEEIQRELVVSREKLIAERLVDPSFVPFCYPNGDFTDRIAGMVKDALYSLAVTTRRGWNGPDSDSYRLRRIGVHQDMTSTPAMFGARLAGVF